MNSLRGKIVAVESSEHISLVELDSRGDIFSAVILESPETASYLRVGNEISILFKETEVAIGKENTGNISIRNIFPCRIISIEHGAILSSIRLDYKGEAIHSIITTKSARRLNLHVGDEVVGLVKSNEITLMA